MLLQVQRTELQRVTTQLAEEQSMVEVKQAEISKLGHRLTDSQHEVAALQQKHASAVKANSAAAQVGNISACCLAVVLQLHISQQQLIFWYVCSTLPGNDATMLDIQKGAGPQ